MAAKKHTPPPEQKPIPAGVKRPTSPPPPRKSAAKRKPAKKQSVDLDQVIKDLQAEQWVVKPSKPSESSTWRPWLIGGAASAVFLVLGLLGGIYAAGGIEIGGDVRPGPVDCLSQAHAADRLTQIAVLRDLASQPFDGATDEGREKAGQWFNAQRFRNRPSDFSAYTDAVAEAIAGNSEAELAKKLEGK